MQIDKLPSGVVARFTDKPVRLENLFPEERIISSQYEQRRIDDFAKGRYCAHQCLQTLDHSQPINQSKDGSPVWPDGFTGSISHSQPFAGAILSRKENYLSVGLDIEKIGRITQDLWPILYSKSELTYLTAQPIKLQSQLSTIIYSLKEAFYKMQFPLFKIGMEHKDLQILFDERRKVRLILNKPVSDKFNKHNTVINYEIKEAFVISYVLLSL